MAKRSACPSVGSWILSGIGEHREALDRVPLLESSVTPTGTVPRVTLALRSCMRCLPKYFGAEWHGACDSTFQRFGQERTCRQTKEGERAALVTVTPGTPVAGVWHHAILASVAFFKRKHQREILSE